MLEIGSMKQTFVQTLATKNGAQVAGLDRDAAQKLDEDLMSAEGGFSKE